MKTSLTIISGRAQLLARAVRRSPSLGDEERARMVAGLAEIAAAVRAMVAIIDATPGERSDQAEDAAQTPP